MLTEIRLLSRPDPERPWNFIDRVTGENETLMRRQADKLIDGWRRSAADPEGPFYGFEFRLQEIVVKGGM